MDEDAGGAELSELSASARGWHTVQLAVLGFIGLCGVLQGAAEADNPRWLEMVAGTLVLAALVVACAATVLVASVAWPLPLGERPAWAGDVRDGASRVRRGIALTFVAVVLLALATGSSWWPSEEGDVGGSVEVTTRRGVLCGTLVTVEQGAVALDIGGRRVVLSLADVVSLAPTDGCPH